MQLAAASPHCALPADLCRAGLAGASRVLLRRGLVGGRRLRRPPAQAGPPITTAKADSPGSNKSSTWVLEDPARYVSDRQRREQGRKYMRTLSTFTHDR